MRRYALYFTPEDHSALARFGWGWLGRTPERGDGALPGLGLDPDWHAALVAEARGYGFHATLKPPFRLAGGASRADLVAAADSFAAACAPFTEPPPVLEVLDGFLALRPSMHSAALHELADSCVRDFDRFRAPPTEAELVRRLRASLSGRQRQLLAEWGYPYVFDQFRFHLTLTRRLADAERAPVAAALAPLAAEALAEPMRVAALSLFEQEAAGAPFLRTASFPFGG